ncbi:hypothetical protein Vretimale_4561, partial [Volvox reticuliferus]
LTNRVEVRRRLVHQRLHRKVCPAQLVHTWPIRQVWAGKASHLHAASVQHPGAQQHGESTRLGSGVRNHHRIRMNVALMWRAGRQADGQPAFHLSERPWSSTGRSMARVKQ